MKILSENIRIIQEEFNGISYSLDERQIRLWCAAKARAYNRVHSRGGVMAVHKATGISRPRIYAGLKEIISEDKLDKSCVRRSGGGRKRLTEKHPDILKELEALVDPLTSDPDQ
mmetsp:Transcript_5387/g.3105  ORF Transcript_5387/g.3105 Transcript_5387/m.3105 type:complete len:114 (-) Transcript_5387:1036-1377(-)